MVHRQSRCKKEIPFKTKPLVEDPLRVRRVHAVGTIVEKVRRFTINNIIDQLSPLIEISRNSVGNILKNYTKVNAVGSHVCCRLSTKKIHSTALHPKPTSPSQMTRYPLYSPDLVPSGFFLFPKLKKRLVGVFPKRCGTLIF